MSEGVEQAVLSGTIVEGRHRIDEAVGRGGYATVWKAHHLRLGQELSLLPFAEEEAAGIIATGASSLAAPLFLGRLLAGTDADVHPRHR